MSHHWPNLQELIDCEGEVAICHRGPATRMVTATQEDQVYAMLRSGDRELLPEVLDLLDEAVHKAIEDDLHRRDQSVTTVNATTTRRKPPPAKRS